MNIVQAIEGTSTYRVSIPLHTVAIVTVEAEKGLNEQEVLDTIRGTDDEPLQLVKEVHINVSEDWEQLLLDKHSQTGYSLLPGHISMECDD